MLSVVTKKAFSKTSTFSVMDTIDLIRIVLKSKHKFRVY